jgi:hypothetical protein
MPDNGLLGNMRFSDYTEKGKPYAGASFDSFMREGGVKGMTGLYENIARHGIYGESGVNDIMAKVRQSRGFQRRALARGLRKRFGSRLGPRSGAVDTMVTNNTYGPAMAQDAATEAELRSTNMQSRMGGVEGIMNIIRFLQQRQDLEDQRDAQKPGWLDFAAIGADVGGSFFGAPGAGTATKKAVQY